MALFPQLAYLGVTFLGATMLMRWAMSQMDPNKDSKKRVRVFIGKPSRLSGRAVPCLHAPVKLDGAGESVKGLVAGCGKEEGDTAQNRQASRD